MSKLGVSGGRFPIFVEIDVERDRQDELFPNELTLPYVLQPAGGRRTWMTIARAWCDRAQREGVLTHDDIIDEESAELLAATTREEKRKEAIQVAACCVKLVEQIDAEIQAEEQSHAQG